MRAFFASELEFYLFDESHAAIAARQYRAIRGPASRYIEDYHVYQTTKVEPLMRAIRNGLAKRWDSGRELPRANGAPGQQEINVRYADALEMADRHVILKNAIKEIAHAQGKAVTFMAKWRYDLAGSSSHVHQSLWDETG
jgi:glutamine synthetase